MRCPDRVVGKDWCVGSIALYAVVAAIVLIPVALFGIAMTRTFLGESATEWWIAFTIWLVGIVVWWSGAPFWIAAVLAAVLVAGGLVLVTRHS